MYRQIMLVPCLLMAGCPVYIHPPTVDQEPVEIIRPAPRKMPILVRIAAEPTHGPAPLTVRFDNAAGSGNELFTKVIWNFGDGTTNDELETTHTYTKPGIYQVSLDVETEKGIGRAGGFVITVEAPKKKPVEVGTIAPPVEEAPDDETDNTPVKPKDSHAIPPVAFMTVASGPDGLLPAGPPPLTFHFSDQSDYGSRLLISRKWDFGDGTTSTEQNPSHTYTKSGTYTVTLTITTGAGTSTDSSSDIVVGEADNGDSDAGIEDAPNENPPPVNEQMI